MNIFFTAALASRFLNLHDWLISIIFTIVHKFWKKRHESLHRLHSLYLYLEGYPGFYVHRISIDELGFCIDLNLKHALFPYCAAKLGVFLHLFFTTTVGHEGKSQWIFTIWISLLMIFKLFIDEVKANRWNLFVDFETHGCLWHAFIKIREWIEADYDYYI